MVRAPFLFLCLGIALAGTSLTDDEATVLANGFKSVLGSALKQKLQSEGPVAAIDFCSQNAATLTASYSEEHQVEIRRITQSFRNPAARLEPGELDLLKLMEEDLAGNRLKPLYRLGERAYQPLLIEAPCLICHGQELAPPVLEALRRHYPEDKARGYAPGALRGAIVIQKRP